jgi:hypothetical protein
MKCGHEGTILDLLVEERQYKFYTCTQCQCQVAVPVGGPLPMHCGKATELQRESNYQLYRCPKDGTLIKHSYITSYPEEQA